MVSLLMRSGSNVALADNDTYSPLHVASRQGHMAIIVALVEEGGADVNIKGGERGDTPLMLSARSGHSEAARYLVAKGADVTAVDENGDSALSVAKSPSMVRLLKEAWTEQTQVKSAQDKNSDVIDTPSGACSPVLDQAHTINEGNSGRDSPSDSDHSVVSPQQPDKKSFFLTDRRLSRSLDFEDSDITDHEMLIPGWSLIVYYELLSCIKEHQLFYITPSPPR